MELLFWVLKGFIVVYGQEGGPWCVCFLNACDPWQCSPWDPKVIKSWFINAWPSLICDCQFLGAQQRLCWTAFSQLCVQYLDNLMFSPRGQEVILHFIYIFSSNLLLVSEQIYIYPSTLYVYIHGYRESIHSISRNNPAVLQFTQLQGIIFKEAAAWSLHFSLQQTTLLCFSFASTC